jgi:hypothetical protein
MSSTARYLPLNDEFKNEVFSSYHPHPVRACSYCREQPSLVLRMLNPRNGQTVRMYRCDCGEQTWTEDAQ